jgi:hypothetical protein
MGPRETIRWGIGLNALHVPGAGNPIPRKTVARNIVNRKTGNRNICTGNIGIGNKRVPESRKRILYGLLLSFFI